MVAIKAGPAKREWRHVKTLVTMHTQLHTKAISARRGEVLEFLGKAAKNTTIPARLAARNAAASRIVPTGFLWDPMCFFPFLVGARSTTAA
jgi:hypothetical protein